MSKQWFPLLLVPVVLLGAGCTQSSQIEIEPVVVEQEQNVQEEPAVVSFSDGSDGIKKEGREI